jgi:hypothetical protein
LALRGMFMTAVRLVVMRVWLHSRIIGSGVVPAQPGLLGGGPRRAGFFMRRRHAASRAAPLAPEKISPLAVTLSRRPRLARVMVVRKRPR